LIIKKKRNIITKNSIGKPCEKQQEGFINAVTAYTGSFGLREIYFGL
jgi:hypothetical protein